MLHLNKSKNVLNKVQKHKKGYTEPFKTKTATKTSLY